MKVQGVARVTYVSTEITKHEYRSSVGESDSKPGAEILKTGKSSWRKWPEDWWRRKTVRRRGDAAFCQDTGNFE